MKKFLLLGITAVVLLFLSLPQISLSEIKEGSIEISPFIGGYFFDHQNDQLGAGLRAGYNFTKNWGVEGAFDFAGKRGQFYHADVVYHIIPDGKINPFVFAGTGFDHLKPFNNPTTRMLVELGAGVKYFFTDNLAVRADIRDIQDKYNHLAMTLGVVYTFGGKKPVYVKAAPVEPPPPPKPAPAPAPKPVPPPPAPKVIDKMTLHVNFDFDKSTLTKTDVTELQKAVAFVKKYPGGKIRVDGHTDWIGSDAYNIKLSERRAATVKDYLIKEAGVAPSNITAVGHGKREPVADNKTDAGRAENRRVEIAILSD